MLIKNIGGGGGKNWGTKSERPRNYLYGMYKHHVTCKTERKTKPHYSKRKTKGGMDTLFNKEGRKLKCFVPSHSKDELQLDRQHNQHKQQATIGE